MEKQITDEESHRVWFVWATSSKRIIHASDEPLLHRDAMTWLVRYQTAGYKVLARGPHDWSKRESLQAL